MVKKKNDMIPLFQSPAVGFEMVTSFSSLLQLLLVALDVSSFPDSVQVKSEDLENLLDRCKQSWKMAVKWFGVYVCECFVVLDLSASALLYVSKPAALDCSHSVYGSYLLIRLLAVADVLQQ